MADNALSQENAFLKARLAETEAALADAVEAQRRLERIVGELQREKFGPRSEKLDPDQFNLPLEERAIEAPLVQAQWRVRSPRAYSRRRRSGPGRR